MTVLDVFLSMRWEYKVISLVIWGVVGFASYLILKTLKKVERVTKKVDGIHDHDGVEVIHDDNGQLWIHGRRHSPVRDKAENPIKPDKEVEEKDKHKAKPIVIKEVLPFHPDDPPIKHVDIIPKTPAKPEHPHMKNFPKKEKEDLRPYQREGIHGYTRKPRKGLELESYTQRKAEELTKKEAWSELSESFWDTRMEGLKQFYPEIYKEIRYWETHLDDYNTRIGMMWVFGIPLGKYDLWVRRRKQ